MMLTVKSHIMYTQLQKKVYTFRFVEYSEGSGPEMNLRGAQYSLWGWSKPCHIWLENSKKCAQGKPDLERESDSESHKSPRISLILMKLAENCLSN